MNCDSKVNVTSLQIATTAKCNLDCSFCGGASYMVKRDASRAKFHESIESALDQHPTINSVVWTGGEPLLALSKVKELEKQVRELRPEITHDFLTNGHNLKEEHVDYLNTFDCVTVSIDGYSESERPLMAFIEDDRYEALRTIYHLKNVNTWGVVTAKQLNNPTWFEDIIQLHNAIYHLNFTDMSLILDNKISKPLSTDQVLNFVYGYKRIDENIKRLNEKYKRICGFSLNSFFKEHNCNSCSNMVMIEPDADTRRPCDVNIVTDAGCNSVAARIGVEVHKYLTSFLYPKKVK